MLRQPCTPRLEEGAVDDQLTAASNRLSRLALPRPSKILPFHGNPRHPPSLGGSASRARVRAFSLTRAARAQPPTLRQHNRRVRMAGCSPIRSFSNCLGRGQASPNKTRCRMVALVWLFGGCENLAWPFDRCELQMWARCLWAGINQESLYIRRSRVHEIPSTEPATCRSTRRRELGPSNDAHRR